MSSFEEAGASTRPVEGRDTENPLDLSQWGEPLTSRRADSGDTAQVVASAPRAATQSADEAKRDASFFGWSYIAAVTAGLIPVFISHQAWMIPIGAMIAYSFAGYKKAERGGTVFEFADSIYYLGFTLSVGSLLASLEPFRPRFAPDPGQIFHLFGLGMLTTLIGVVTRTSLQTFHRLPSETIEEVNRRLALEAHRYVERLTKLNNDAEALITGTANSFQERIAPQLVVAEVQLNATVECLTKSAAATTTLSERTSIVDSTLERLLQRYEATVNGVEKANTVAAKSSTDLATALSAAASNASKTLAPAFTETAATAAIAQAALATFASRVNSTTVDSTPLNDSIAAAGRSVGLAASTALEEVRGLGMAVTEFQRNAAAARDASLAIADPQLRQRLARLSEELEQLTSAARDQRIATQTEVESMRHQVTATLSAAQGLSQVLEEVASVALERLKQLPPALPRAP
jgi:hypothetical protein